MFCLPSLFTNVEGTLYFGSRFPFRASSYKKTCIRQIQTHPCDLKRLLEIPFIDRVMNSNEKGINLCSYLTDDIVVTAAVMAILVRVSSDPVDDFLVLTPLTLLLSITVEVLSGGGMTLVLTENNTNLV